MQNEDFSLKKILKHENFIRGSTILVWAAITESIFIWILETFEDTVLHPTYQGILQALLPLSMSEILVRVSMILLIVSVPVYVLYSFVPRKSAESLIRESEDFYQFLFNQIPIGVGIANSNGQILSANKKMQEITGYSVEDLKQVDVYDMYANPEDRDEILRDLQYSGVVKEKEIRLKRKDGSIYDAALDIAYFEINNLSLLSTVTRDISKYKTFEKSLRKSEEKYRILFEDAPIALWEEDFSSIKSYFEKLYISSKTNFGEYLDTHPEVIEKCAKMVKIINVNKAALELYGAKEKETLINILPYRLCHEAGSAFKNELVAIAENRTRISEKIRFTTLSNEQLLLRMTWYVAKGHEKDYSKVLVSTLNITHIEHAKEQLQKNEQKYKKLVESSPVLICTLNPQGETLFVNNYVKQMTGYDIEEIIGHNWWDVFYPNENKEQVETLYENFKRRDVIEYEMTMTTKDGNEKPVLWNSFNVWDSSMSLIQINGVGLDISDLKETELNLRREMDRTMLFLDLMGHDIRNILQGTFLGLDLIEQSADNPKIIHFVNEIEKTLDRCDHIISKAKSTEQLIKAPLITQLLNEIILKAVCYISSEDYDGIIEFDLSHTDMVVRADILLEKAFIEILENALEHNSSTEKCVWVNLEEKEDGYLVSIADNGPGMDDETKAHLFDVTSRIAGLGLHLANQIIEKHNGKIHVLDRIRGTSSHGTEFLIWLPKPIN
jgi:PAS domain S-box-containing protein